MKTQLIHLHLQKKTTVNQADINDKIIPAEWMLVRHLVPTGFNVPLNTL